MPVGWPLHIDGAVRQCCIHRAASLQELDDMLKEYDMKRDSVEINRDAPQWSHHAVWNRKYWGGPYLRLQFFLSFRAQK